MKKLLLVGALALFASVNAQQAGLNIGAHAGLPMGSNPSVLMVPGAGTVSVGSKTTSSFALGLDASYLFSVSDQFLVGPGVGYQAFLGKEIEENGAKFKYNSTSIIPLVASSVYKINDQFGIGIDLGYGIAFGGELKSVDGDSLDDIANDLNQMAPGAGTAIKNALEESSKAKSGFLYHPKVYYSFGNSSLWLGYQGLNTVGSTGSVNLGFSYSLAN